MIKRNEWDAAYARLKGFHANMPNRIKEETVQQYHEILADLQSSSGAPLEKFKIPQEKLRHEIASLRMASYSGRPGSASYTKDRYCDSDYF